MSETAAKNIHCPYDPGTPECLSATWVNIYNPCQECDWWDEFAGEDE